MNFAVLQFPGSNCDQDVVHVLRNVLGHSAELLWHKEPSLGAADAVIVPGGFSYGDYLRTGAIARFSPVMEAVQGFAAGMLTPRPNAISQKLPFDAPAIASTLSVDMVRSATTMYQMACRKRVGAGARSGGVLASISTLTAIHRISSPPAICRYGTVSRRAATAVSATRNRSEEHTSELQSLRH